jgi:hypothetical protein
VNERLRTVTTAHGTRRQMLRPLVLATALTVVRGFVLRVPVLPRHNSIGGAAGVLAATQRNCASYTKAELPNIDGTGSLRTLVTYPAIMVRRAVCIVDACCARLARHSDWPLLA